MKYDIEERQITIEKTDPLYSVIKEYFKDGKNKKLAITSIWNSNIIFSVDKLEGLLIHLSTNNDGKATSLGFIADLLLAQMEIQKIQEESLEFNRQRRNMVVNLLDVQEVERSMSARKITNNLKILSKESKQSSRAKIKAIATKVNNSFETKGSLPFAVFEGDPEKTFDSLLVTIKKYAKALSEEDSDNQFLDQDSYNTTSYYDNNSFGSRSASDDNSKETKFEPYIASNLKSSDSYSQNGALQSKFEEGKARLHAALEVKQDERVRKEIEKEAKEIAREKIQSRSAQQIFPNIEVTSHKSKIEKYFSYSSTLSKLRSAVKAQQETDVIENDLNSSEIIKGEQADPVAFSAKKLYEDLAKADKLGKVTFEDFGAIAERDKKLKSVGTAGKMWDEVKILGNSVISKDALETIAIQRKSVHQALDSWVMQKTTTSRSIAQLSAEIKLKNYQQGPFLYRLFRHPMQTWRSYRANSLVKEMRAIQEQTRIAKNDNSQENWEKTITKYVNYAQEVNKYYLSAAGNEANAIRDRLTKASDALATLSNQSSLQLDEEQIRDINKKITKVMNSAAQLEILSKDKQASFGLVKNKK